MKLELDLNQYQIDQLNLIRRSSKFSFLSLHEFIELVLKDWLRGGVYLSDSRPFSD